MQIQTVDNYNRAETDREEEGGRGVSLSYRNPYQHRSLDQSSYMSTTKIRRYGLTMRHPPIFAPQQTRHLVKLQWLDGNKFLHYRKSMA